MAIAFVGLAIVALAPRKNVVVGRAVYWAGTLVASVSVFFMAFPPDWKSGIGMSSFTLCAITAIAYLNTPFIKGRGRTYAFYSQHRGDRDDTRPEPYGGGVSVKKSWWRATFVVGLLASSVFLHFAQGGNPWLAGFSGAAIVLVAIFFGYRDATLPEPIAAGQGVQFALMTAMTLGAFAALYLGTYFVDRRWNLSRRGQGRHSQ